MTGDGIRLECGCEFHSALVPCDEHSTTLDSGDEYLHIALSFENKYSRWGQNKHKVNLERVQRIHLELDDAPMEFSAATVADMLQDIADEEPTANAAFVLRALANVLRGEDSHHRLVLQQVKRGKWLSPSDHMARKRQHLAWIIRLSRLQRDGWQTDAAVHRIAETTGNSVSRVYAGIAEERQWQEHAREFAKAIGGFKKLKRERRSRSPD